MNNNWAYFAWGGIFILLLLIAKEYFWPKRICPWNDKIPEGTIQLEDLRQKVGICSRDPAHEGPCNGLPRQSCPGYEAWKKTSAEMTISAKELKGEKECH